MQLYRSIELPSEEPVQFIGRAALAAHVPTPPYVLRWPCPPGPAIGFREATEQEIIDAAGEVLGFYFGVLQPSPPADE